ncbi:outer membrane beta-barrel protein [Bradyrhizobium sp. ARR65]|uniref:outer membrane beta-barrel protein n=1 Tax=Bradyrhizobium sp. ARR65 TaxID=1040989 RepID=UPI001FDAA2AA|nr:outer membrane beta-barrel protein [Bradyrhizobium sp. ARR65]
MACLWLAAFAPSIASAQTLTSDLFNPKRGAFVPAQQMPFRKIGDDSADDSVGSSPPNPNQARSLAPGTLAPVGQSPGFGLPAGDGIGDAGFDSLNRKRKLPKYYPGQVRPKPSPGPGTPPPPPPQVNAVGDLRLSIPPSEMAARPPVPPAVAGSVPGQPQRRRLKLDDDPFGAVGDYAGAFLVKTAVELSGGYDTNPGRLNEPHGLPSWVVAPEFLAVSNWDRHALVADLRGSFTGYGGSLPTTIDGAASPAPTNVDRPNFIGHVDGRLDVSSDTDITAQLRLNVATDNPGSPNVQVGLKSYPIYATLGGTLGFDQRFNRLTISGGATVDRTSYQNSTLTDGTTSSNDDRNFNQYGGVGRISYEVLPGLKPFAEVEGDTRVHDLQFDRNGYQRDSSGGYAKAGTSFEFTRLITGEVSIGYAARNYVDPRLNRLDGLLTSASLIWTATPLTTAKFYSDTQIAETTVPGTSGTLIHTYTFEVDHDFRRWLTGIGKFTYGTLDYQGDNRNDTTYSIEGDVIYKMTRYLWLKGTLRYDALDSNVVNASSKATVVMLGVRLQN